MILLNDLKRAAHAEAQQLFEAAQRVFDSGWYVLGREVAAFEQMFADYCGVGHCIGVGNGTDALELSMRALGLGRGDGVVMAANAGMYAATAAMQAGCHPVYCDVDETTMLICPDAMARLDDPSIKAVVVTHLYGLLAAMPALLAVARRRNWSVIEDCAQAHGAQRDGRRAGAWGDLAAFSFYPTKNLGAVGDGGAVVTADAELAAAVRTLSQYGWGTKYEVLRSGGCNSRLDELQAAVLAARLPALDQANARRRAIAGRYAAAIAGTGLLMHHGAGDDHVHHLCILRCTEREAFRDFLHEQGVASDIHYPVPDHRQQVWAGQYNPVQLPVTERLAREVVTVPCHPWMTDAEVEKVATHLADWRP
ncbi:MAG: DegT/DnrJ/EryC1/StrS family aminotransferase [Lysobacterales bacterium]